MSAVLASREQEPGKKEFASMLRSLFRYVGCVAAACIVLLGASRVQAAAIRAGFNATVLPGNDDGSTGLVSIGFNVNFFGPTYSQLYVNNNGNVTFTTALSTFTPFGLTGATSIPIIASFFGDVDTRPLGSALTLYGTGTVDGHAAFGVTWDGVGYYGLHTDKLNKFQLLLIDRSDTGVGNFDIEFNYDQIQWETGDASGGSGGVGGQSARIGYSNGSGTPGSFFELPGSGVNGAFLDSNLATGLIYNSLGTTVDGRYIFNARAGSVVPADPVPEPGSLTLLGLSALGIACYARRRRKVVAV
jgi:hypothetical protein